MFRWYLKFRCEFIFTENFNKNISWQKYPTIAHIHDPQKLVKVTVHILTWYRHLKYKLWGINQLYRPKPPVWMNIHICNSHKFDDFSTIKYLRMHFQWMVRTLKFQHHSKTKLGLHWFQLSLKFYCTFSVKDVNNLQYDIWFSRNKNSLSWKLTVVSFMYF